MFLAVLAAGCVQMDVDLNVKSDRSATADISYSLTEQVVSQFRQVFEVTDRLVTASAEDALSTSAMRVFLDPREETVKQYVSTLSTYEIKLTEVRVRESSGRRTVRVSLAFGDLQKAAGAPVFKNAGLRFGRRPDGLWELAREGSESDAPVTESALKEVSPMLSGFTARIKVRTPGAVMETTAPRKSPRGVDWEFDFGRSPEAAVRAFSAPLRVAYAP